MKLNIKKVATVLGSALMLGSTVGMAAAASFTPSSFTDGGVALVVGSNAALSDMKAATDLAANLAGDLAAQTATGSTTTVTGGDSVLIQSGSDNLNLGNALSIVGTLNDEDMETFLASGEYKDINKVDYDYDQEISVAATTLAYTTSSAYKDKTPVIGLFYEKDANVLNYSIDFGSLNFTNAIGTDLPLMNNMYYVLDYDSTGLTLLDSSASATISEGETTTLTVNGKSYEITLDFVGDATTDYAKFTVNGESTDKINEGADDELADGSYIAVKEVLYSSKESGVSKVEFTIGTGKLLLPTSGEIEMNDERVVNVDSSVNSTTGVLSIVWNTDAKTVLTEAGDEMILPGFETIKLSYNGMNFPTSPEMTVLDAAGVIELDTVVKDGAVSIPLVNFDAINTTTGNLTYIGDDSDSKLVLGSANTTNSQVNLTDIGDYFIATYVDDDDFVSYVYQLDSIKLGSDGKTEVVLDNLASSSTNDDITFAEIGRTRTKGELTFTLVNASETTEDVLINVSGSAISTRKLATKTGLSIDLSNLVTTTNFTADGFVLTMVEQDKDGDFQEGSPFTVTLVQSADENIQVSATNVSTLETKTDDVYEGYMLTDVATKVKLDKTDADAQDFAIMYNGQEVKAEVYVAASTATISAGSGSAVSNVGTVTVYDNEVSSVSGKNLIVIGGSCINSVAAELLGGAACDAAFTAKTGIKSGEALIKSFARGGKVALLVAGYNAADTTTAITYLSNKAVDTTVDAAVKVVDANTATAITA